MSPTIVFLLLKNSMYSFANKIMDFNKQLNKIIFLMVFNKYLIGFKGIINVFDNLLLSIT